MNGTSGNYVYKLNADLNYQTVVLAWTADGIYFYKADASYWKFEHHAQKSF
ncbi:MAG: hypothetical protein IPG07_20550 [Crocinitomicaceae bacterium]|nr:hypothetical protein [Crocinitomicaceae bacterium]